MYHVHGIYSVILPVMKREILESLSLCVCLSVHVSGRFLEDIFLTAQTVIIKFGMVIHHHEPECRAKRLLGYFQGHGHTWGLMYSK